VIARARAADPNTRHQSAAELRDALRDAATADDAASASAAAAAVAVREPLTASPLTALPVTVTDASDAGLPSDPSRTARATGVAVTSVLPAAAAASVAVTPPPRTGATAAAKARRFRRAKSPHPKLAKVPKPLKPMKPPKPKRRVRKAAAAAGAAGVLGPAAPVPTRQRTWKLRHWVAVLTAPLLLVAGGIVAYAKLTERGPMVAVPDVTGRDVFAAAGVVHAAGFSPQLTPEDSPRPGGVVLSQRPTTGRKLEEGSTVKLTVSSTEATVPDVTTLDIGAARVRLAERGLNNVTVTPDYRDDVDSGTVMRTNPSAYLRTRKLAPLELVVAADPHVNVPNVIGQDQATATTALQAIGLDVTVDASSSSKPVGQVLKTSPSVDHTAVRGDTITITVSSGPKQVNVPYVVGSNRDDAIGELEDRNFAVNVVTVAVTSNSQVDVVLAQDPTGGRAAEGSTVTVTLGAKAKR
jgi:beta-lactam-binding protein with PASTA domain